VGPPFTGYGYETPGSLACLYGLVAAAAGCNPNTAKTVSAKGSRAIALVDAYNYPTALQDLQKFSTQFGPH
jgi:subtilase family serine protease